MNGSRISIKNATGEIIGYETRVLEGEFEMAVNPDTKIIFHRQFNPKK